MTRGSSRRGRTTAAALLTLVALLVAGLGTTLASPAEAGHGSKAPGKSGKSGKPPKTVDKPWAGFKIDDDGRASGGFLGARIIDSTIVYRIDPKARKTVAKTFSPPVFTDALVGSGKKAVTALDTQRAAYILGKYGSYDDKVQAAAVEVALDELLVGGPYALTGKATKARLAQLTSKQRSAVKDLAGDVLVASQQFASTYAVAMTSTPSVTLGGQVTTTVRVTSRATGAGIARLPVVISYPGAAPTGELRTDDTGAASAVFTATAAGPQTASANVQGIPESRLLVLTPTPSKASRVVVADLKTATAVTAVTAVKAKPTLSIVRSFGSIATPFTTKGQTVTLAATYGTARTATATLWGPYTSDAAATCTGAGKQYGTGTIAMKANGSYALPVKTLGAKGYYRWQVSLPADAYNIAAPTICAGVMVRSTAP